MKTKKIAAKITRTICLLLALCMLAGIPTFRSDAAGVVEKGIDVSKWQGQVNWQAVAQSGVTFAFVRVGSTKKGIDEFFYYNMIAAQQAGIKTGVYLYSYASNVQEAAAEAQFVLNALQNENIQVSYPVVWDVEDSIHKSLSPETLSLMANTFCAAIEAEGYYPMVYTSTTWYQKRIGPVLYDKWVAQYASSCQIPDAAIWQYSNTGKVPGINGNVDLNFSFRDYSQSIVNTGWVDRKGFTYFYVNYRMQRGWIDLGTAKYYLDANGHRLTGWLPLEDGMYYLNPDGAMAVGFTPIGEGMYCFGGDGRMLTGWQTVGDRIYCFTPEGVMYTGLQNLDGSIYYFGTDGAMQAGWQTIGDQVYHFGADGKMLTGWQTIGDQIFLFAAEGPLVRGLFNDGVYNYYLAPDDGHLLTGFQDIAGKICYFDEAGHMVTGAAAINGLSYLFAADGAMFTGWFNDGVSVRYYEADGHMVVGLATVNDSIYYFDVNGIMQTGVVEIEGVPYMFDIDGKMLPQPQPQPQQ